MLKIEKEKLSKEKLQQLNVKNWGTWECEPSTFDWSYDSDETCYILEGHVKVKTPHEEVEIGAGDFVKFPKGLSCTWQVDKKIRKHYTFDL